MQVLLLIGGLFYVAVIPVLFISWLEFFHHDRDNLTQQEQRISIVMIAIASVFWVIALPFAYLELLDKFKRSSRAAKLYQQMLEAPKSQSDEIQLSNH
ncbi:MAG: hypothetical protein KME10_09820 [Plectolyngbya sp. WJT66-NPBG17]|nr:hypothetical protein [Plectolyngbya sp. WJT66-NPBG17]MBW4525640.1 hypothetical protein [Phormidium tanganyikae FI6-MK23]